MVPPASTEPPQATDDLTPAVSQTGGPAAPSDPLVTADYTGGGSSPSVGPVTDPAADLAAAFGDRFTLEPKLGQGGFGSVFAAFDQRLSRRVAIKVTAAKTTDPDRLLREARALAQLRHPGIVAVYDVAVAGGHCFVVSELLPGPSLADWAKSAPPPAEVAAVVAEVADALAHAHARSIVHRDLKPSNVVFGDGRRPVLVDFGLALSDQDAASERGVVSGTPAYMSPEQAAGRAHRPDGRTDVYGLGATLYALLTGRAPFRGTTTVEVLRQVREDDPPPPRQLRPDVPAAIEAACLKALAKLPADRFTTAADFAAALRAPSPLAAMHPAPPAPPRAAAPARAERRQVTLLQLAFEPPADDDDPTEPVAAFQAACAAAVAEHGGRPLQTGGTGFLALFGYPTAREDAPRQAVRAGLAACAAVPAAGAAVGTGTAVVTPGTPAAVVGDVTAAVAAVAALGAGGVTVTDATFRLAADYFDTAPAGEVRPRGAAAVPVHRVTAERAGRSRVDAADPARLTPLVGRDREVELLRERWALAGEGVRNVILLVADPGLGKSRLVRTLKDHALGRGGDPGDSHHGSGRGGPAPAAVEWYCSPYHAGSPFYPVTDYFDRAYGLGREPDPARRLDLLLARLRGDGVTDAEDIALFAAMLSVPAGDRLPALALSADRQKERTVDAVLSWLAARAAAAPVLFVVEDLHWVDPSTEQLLARFVEDGGATQVLGVFTFRPEYDPPWKGKAVQTQVALNRLTRAQVGELVRAQAGPDVPAAVVGQIADRTDGVPLFVEEFTRLVAEGGKAGLETAIPATLHDLLLARLDRMASDREVVQLGATIGRTFGYDLIRAATDRDEAVLRAELRKLVDAGLLFPKGAIPRATYTFKHALIQDAAYQSLVKTTRQQLHGRVAAALAAAFPDVVETQPEVLAHHHGEAGDTARAVGYWLAAGDRAQRRSAHLEAIGHMTRGLAAAGRLPDGPERTGAELRFRLLLSGSYLATRGYAAPAVDAEIQRAKALCAAIDPGGAMAFGIDMVIWALTFIQGRNVVAKRLSDDLRAVAARPGMEGFRADAEWTATCTDWWAGRYAAALAAADHGAAAYHPETAAAVAAMTQQNCGPLLDGYAGLALWGLGRREAARARQAASVAAARALNHPSTLAVVIYKPGIVARMALEGAEAERWADELMALCEQNSFVFWHAQGAGLKGAALAVQGRHAEAVPVLRKALADIAATGGMKVTQTFETYLAESLWATGDPAGAWVALDRAFAAAAADDSEHYFLPEMHRRRGHFLAATDPAAAEAEFAAALRIADEQGARYLALRAATDLGRAWAAAGRAAAARELVAARLAAIPEPGATADEAAARAFLAGAGG